MPFSDAAPSPNAGEADILAAERKRNRLLVEHRTKELEELLSPDS